MSASESDAVSEEIEGTEVEELTSDSDDASTEVEEPSDESSENNDYDDDDDDDNAVSSDEDLDEQTQDILGKKRKNLNKRTLMLENEINNHAIYEGASLMSYQILMNEEEQKSILSKLDN